GGEPCGPRAARARRLSRAPSRGAPARQGGGAEVTSRGLSLAIALAAAAATAGCGTTAPSRFYTLDSTATPGGGPPLRAAVAVGPVSIPASVDRPQFVVQVAPNRVELDEFNRWAAPLGDAIAGAVAGDLAALLGTPDVSAGPLAVDPAY